MRNLLLLQERCASIPIQLLQQPNHAPTLDIACTWFDAPSRTLHVVTHALTYFAFSIGTGGGSGGANHLIGNTSGGPSIQSQINLADIGVLDEKDSIIAMQWLAELECIVAASSTGQLLTLHSMIGSEDVRVEAVQTIPGGISSMSWSPDEELCVIATRDNRLMVLTKDFESMYERDLFPSDQASASSTELDYASLHDRFGGSSISWRGDGQFFVVSCVEPRTTMRYCIVFDRQLEEQSKSEGVKPQPKDGPSDGMPSSLVWRPSGNLFFTSAHRRISAELTKHEVWAWEKNALRHGEINLANVVTKNTTTSSTPAAAPPSKIKPSTARRKKGEDEEEDEGAEDTGYSEEVDESKVDSTTSISAASDARVLDMSWNADSDVLCLRMEERSTKKQCLLLYTTGNYHWYLKQEIRPTSQPHADGTPVQLHMRWHTEDARRMIIVESTGLVRYMEYAWDARVNAQSQSRLAVVIDGPLLFLTPVAKQIVPPPMCTWKIGMDLPNTDGGKIIEVSMRASVQGALGLNKRFTMPNASLEATAFLPLDEQHFPNFEPLPPRASPNLFSPTSDIMILTSSGMGVFIENVEEVLGNAMRSTPLSLRELLQSSVLKSNIHPFTLKSEDFSLGNLRLCHWLDAPIGPATDGRMLLESNISSPAASASNAPLPPSIFAASPAILLAVESHPWPASDALVELEIFDGEIQSMYRTPLTAVSVATRSGAADEHAASSVSILRLACNKQHGHVFVQLSDGRVLKYLPAYWQSDIPNPEERVPTLEALAPREPTAASSGNESNALPAPRNLHLPSACPWFDIIRLGGRFHSMGRDVSGRLFIGDTLLTPQCSSFLTQHHPSYIVFTILGQQNALFLLDRSRTLEENMGSDFRSDPHNVRLLERGSHLIALVPSLSSPRVLMQMPRGNLEAIYPRNFSLDSINVALSSLKFVEALKNLRKNKIDPNLIVDHFVALPSIKLQRQSMDDEEETPATVQAGGLRNFDLVAKEFVHQVANLDQPHAGFGVELLNLFISALTDESCIDNQYVRYKPRQLTAGAMEKLRALQRQSDADEGTDETSKDRIRDRLMRSIAAARAQTEGADQDADVIQPDDFSDLGSIASDAAGATPDTEEKDVQPFHAIGEPAPYNYVPRKKGESRGRRAPKTKEEKDAEGRRRRAQKAKEDQRVKNEKERRLEREKIAEEYERNISKLTEEHKSKVNFVCTLLREHLEAEQRRVDKASGASHPSYRFALATLTTYLRQEPKQYEQALQLVKEMREVEKQRNKEQKKTAATTGTSSTAASSAPAPTAPRVRSRVTLPRFAASASTQPSEASSLENKSAIYSGYQGALQYMIFLSDVQTLYRSALACYDLELAILVAQYSHMDPKEYMAFIEKWQEMEHGGTSMDGLLQTKPRPNFQHYSIDLFLGNHSRALESLLSAWQAQEVDHSQENWNKLVLELLKQHPELYVQAIKIMTPQHIRDSSRLLAEGGGGGGGFGDGRFGRSGGLPSVPTYGQPFDPTGGLPAHFLNPSLAPSPAPTGPTSVTPSLRSSTSSAANKATPPQPDDPELKPYFSLLSAYASHLLSSNSYRHAAHAFLMCCQYADALKCLKDAGEWKESLALAYEMGYKPEEIQQLAYDMSAQLRNETKTCLAAATLLIDYCDDVDEAIVVLLKGESWMEILRVVYSKGRTDLLETHVTSEVLAAYNRYVKHCQSHRARYTYAVNRLRVIRRVKLLFPPTIESMADRDQHGGGDRDDDLMSIVSGLSGLTASTTHSSASNLSGVSAFSGRSTSTIASTSSFFSIQADDRRELTPDEKRIQRFQQRLARKAAIKKAVKEGSAQEEEMLCKEIIHTTPMEKHKERISELIHVLLHFGFIDQSRRLQHEFQSFLDEVAKQESTPMPMLENPTPQQREALIRHWNWPQMAHPERHAVPRTDHLTMPFLFEAPAPAPASSSSSAATAKVPLPTADDEDEGDLFGAMM